MAIPNLKTKLKTNLKQSIEESQNAGSKDDKRKLNYYDLKEGEKMTILFVPDVNGEFWAQWSSHGPNLVTFDEKGRRQRVRGVDNINCSYKSSFEDCPVCQKGFDLFAEAKEQGGDKAIKEEGKKWMPKDITLTSCIVIDSPIEINEDDESNQVKLFYLPFAVEKMIKNQIMEGEIPEDELCSTPFVIKKTKNSGGMPSYEDSYFARKQVSDDDVSFLDDDDVVVNQFDYSTIDVIPPNTTTEDMEEWLEKAEEAYDKAVNGSRAKKSSRKEKLDKMSSRRNKSSDDEEQQEEEQEESPENGVDEQSDSSDNDQQEEQQEEEEQEEEKTEKVSSAKAKLDALRQRKKK